MIKGNKNIAEAGKNTRFKKGQSGNPKGATKKLKSLEHIIADVLGSDGTGKDGMTKIIEAMQKQAEKGNVHAANLLLERGFGKVKTVVDIGLGTEDLAGINVTFK